MFVMIRVEQLQRENSNRDSDRDHQWVAFHRELHTLNKTFFKNRLILDKTS